MDKKILNNFSEKEIIDTAQICMAHDFIMDLPLGYNTKITERGTTLSGGQRQRISILRALVKKPKILILDEATSALDSHSEEKIQSAILSLKGKFTMIIIAHRLSTIKDASSIIVIDSGKVCESGTHDELLQNQGKYYALLQKQSMAK